MATASAARRQSTMPAFLSLGFRPFFLGSGLWAAAALTVWIAMLTQGIALPSRFDPLAWHIHEMLFGFVMATIGGFLLTAIPNWTGRLPVRGLPLLVLAGSWLLGRIACLVSAALPAWLATGADLLFPVLLAAAAAREIIAGRNWRNLVVLGPVSLLGVANLLMHLEANGAAIPPGLGWRLGLGAIIVLITVIGGRIVPSFTRNWLAKRPGAALPASQGRLDLAALVVLPVGLALWVAWPDLRAAGVVLLCAAALHLCRLARWRGLSTRAEPLLLVLHIGYAWVVLGVALLGLVTLGVDIPPSAAIHALTAGAIGTMTLAVMTRATRGHAGRPLAADRPTVLIFALVILAALARIAAALSTGWFLPLLVASAALWIAAFACFVLAYAPMLLLPRR
jgi:uncharacterized protein involved in response to NO